MSARGSAVRCLPVRGACDLRPDSSHGTRKLVQAAQGTHRWVPWRQLDSKTEVVQTARADGYRIIAVVPTSRSVSLEAFVPHGPVCLVLGSERSGASQSVLDLAGPAAAIPMRASRFQGTATDLAEA